MFKITIVQPDTCWENVDANISKIQEMLNKHNKKTDMILLPEMFSTGFTMNAPVYAEDQSGKSIEWMLQMASVHDAVVGGSIIYREQDQYFNRYIAAFPDGTLRYYDKKHLFTLGAESQHYSPGQFRMIFGFRGITCCPLVCYDLRFPVWSRNRERYDLLTYVANWPASRQEAWNALLKARAIENQCYVVGVNRVGDDGLGLHYAGESTIAGPEGEIIFRADDQEAVKTITLDIDHLRAVREKFPFLNDADPFELLRENNRE